MITPEYEKTAPAEKSEPSKPVTKSKVSDSVFKDYRQKYKRRFAWIKAGGIESGVFYTWSTEVRKKKIDYGRGRITLEEFLEWLRRS